MADDIPQWAKLRACELANAVKDWAQPVKWGQAQHYALGQAFARYIAEHEEAPLDPLLIEARKLVFDTPASPLAVRPGDIRGCELDDGSLDSDFSVRLAVAALKRGMELAGERS